MCLQDLAHISADGLREQTVLPGTAALAAGLGAARMPFKPACGAAGDTGDSSTLTGRRHKKVEDYSRFAEQIVFPGKLLPLQIIEPQNRYPAPPPGHLLVAPLTGSVD